MDCPMEYFLKAVAETFEDIAADYVRTGNKHKKGSKARNAARRSAIIFTNYAEKIKDIIV
jgi:hypothetical protein